MAEEKDPTALYALGIAIILGALLLSASVYFSVSGLADVIGKKQFNVNVQTAAAGSGNAAAGSQPNAVGGQANPTPDQGQPAAAQRVNVDTTGKHMRGNANAKITIVEFSDFECPYCGAAQPTVKQIEDTYKDNVKVVFMHFPLPFHPNAQKAAEASECAGDQGKFWEMHDWMFANQNSLGVDQLKAEAKTLGLNTTAFNACLDSGKKASIVEADQTKGSNAGVQGTPTFIINGIPVVGAQPFGNFKPVIDAELAK